MRFLRRLCLPIIGTKIRQIISETVLQSSNLEFGQRLIASQGLRRYEVPVIGQKESEEKEETIAMI